MPEAQIPSAVAPSHSTVSKPANTTPSRPSQLHNGHRETIFPPIRAPYDLQLLTQNLDVDWPSVEKRFRQHGHYLNLALHSRKPRASLSHSPHPAQTGHLGQNSLVPSAPAQQISPNSLRRSGLFAALFPQSPPPHPRPTHPPPRILDLPAKGSFHAPLLTARCSVYSFIALYRTAIFR
jgi:hypothetical protein